MPKDAEERVGNHTHYTSDVEHVGCLIPRLPHTIYMYEESGDQISDHNEN